MKNRLNYILLVEDCDADNFLHKRIIEDVDAASNVLVMQSADEALEFLRSNQKKRWPQPELIFLDINTPGMEGWDFIEAFDQLDDSTKRYTVIIMLSGSMNPDDRDRALAIPLIKEYRTKPLTRDVMREIMERYFV